MASKIRGNVYVVKDNIDTDQIIPAQHLNLVPTNPEEYVKLGSYALCGLPDAYDPPFVPPGEVKSPYRIVVAGQNFGCGSSREHAPIALGAAGAKVVVAQSFARIFFRNCIATGELYPVEIDSRICDQLQSGDQVEVDLEANTITVLADGRVFHSKPLGDAKGVVDDGGLFEHARKTGMIN